MPGWDDPEDEIVECGWCRAWMYASRIDEMTHDKTCMAEYGDKLERRVEQLEKLLKDNEIQIPKD